MLIGCASLALCAGFFLDLLLGDPQPWPHLVRGMGWLIARLERLLYPMGNQPLAGAALTFFAALICTALPALALWLCSRISLWLYFALESLLCWQLLAVKSLRVESMRVYQALAQDDLSGARQALSRIVGRDVQALDEAGVIRAAVETVAENVCDGVAAPLFYLMLGGAPLGCFYKVVNTMDSMIGYRNQRYLHFGRFAARLDDAVHFLPSRLCALCMILAAWFCGLDARGAWRVWRRDRCNHASPNSAQTEAVAAGALGVRLGGDAFYFGTLHHKPTIGDAVRPIKSADIRRAHQLLYVTAAFFLGMALLVRGGLYVLL
jgi:adenosylcobinamide-phosphate synthase